MRMRCTRLTTRDRSSTLGRRVAHKDLLVIGIDARILDVTNTVVVPVLPMPLERVHSAEVLMTAPDHHASIERPLIRARAHRVHRRLLNGNPTADPLRLGSVPEVRADVALHVGGPLVRLHVVAEGTLVRVGSGLAPASARRRRTVEDLHIARTWPTAVRGLTGRARAGRGRGRVRGVGVPLRWLSPGTSGHAPARARKFARADLGRWNILVLGVGARLAFLIGREVNVRARPPGRDST